MTPDEFLKSRGGIIVCEDLHEIIAIKYQDSEPEFLNPTEPFWFCSDRRDPLYNGPKYGAEYSVNGKISLIWPSTQEYVTFWVELRITPIKDDVDEFDILEAKYDQMFSYSEDLRDAYCTDELESLDALRGMNGEPITVEAWFEQVVLKILAQALNSFRIGQYNDYTFTPII